MRSPLEIVPAHRLSAARLYGFLDPLYGFPARRPAEEAPFSGIGAAAIEAGEVFGLATLELLPSLEPGETLGLLQAAVAPQRRRQGLASRLLRAAVAEALASAPQLHLLAMPPIGDDNAATAFLTHLGFSELPPLIHYRGPVSAPPAEAPGRLRVRPYRGGEAARDAEILERYRRAFRRHPTTPAIAAAELAAQFADPAFHCLLLYDGERAVGDAQLRLVRGLCFVQSFGLDRSHWGSGAADLLVRALYRFAAAQGCGTLEALVVESNRASTAMIRRTAPELLPVAATRRFTRRLETRSLCDGDPLAA